MNIEVLKVFLGAFLLIGFIYFILIRAINTENYKRKSLYIFISGLVIFLFFCGGLIYDISKDSTLISNQPIQYYAFLIVSFALMIIFTLYYFIKGYKRKQKFSSVYKPQKQIPTIKNKKEFVYIILKLDNNFLLKKEEEQYESIILKFPHNEFFHDEIIKQFIKTNELDIISYDYIGKATKREKNDIIYYCYKIILNHKPNKIDNLETIDTYKLVSVNLNNMNKKILFTSVVENDFDIEIE